MGAKQSPSMLERGHVVSAACRLLAHHTSHITHHTSHVTHHRSHVTQRQPCSHHARRQSPCPRRCTSQPSPIVFCNNLHRYYWTPISRLARFCTYRPCCCSTAAGDVWHVTCAFGLNVTRHQLRGRCKCEVLYCNGRHGLQRLHHLHHHSSAVTRCHIPQRGVCIVMTTTEFQFQP
jgi:hypothetical protein